MALEARLVALSYYLLGVANTISPDALCPLKLLFFFFLFLHLLCSEPVVVVSRQS